MSKQSEIQNKERQVFVIPPVICKEIAGKQLSLFRVKSGAEEQYQLEMDGDVLLNLNGWQYHVLNALFSFGGDKYDTLLVNTNDRFGLNLDRYDIDVLLDKIAKRKLFDKDNAPKHPITEPFTTGKAKVVKSEKKVAGKNNVASSNDNITSGNTIGSIADRITSDFREFFKDQKMFANENKENEQSQSADKDDTIKHKVLFNPTDFLNSYKSTISLGKYLLYALPLLLIAAATMLINNPQMVNYDLPKAISGFGLIGHLLFGLFTVSAVTTFAVSCVAFSYTATVSAISIRYFFGFIPRFVPTIEDSDKLSRQQKLWVHATPLLARLGLFSVAVIMWYNARNLGGVINEFFAFLAFTSIVSFFVASCPFYRSNGYRFLTVLLNEPHLWGKGLNAMLNKFNKSVYTESNSNVLVAYGMACVAFTFMLAAAVFTLAYHWFEIELGKKAIFIVAILVGVFFLRMSKMVKNINEEYNRNLNFERWREGVFPTEPEEAKNEKKEPASLKRQFLIVSAAVLMVLPINYEPSGNVIMLPINKQKLSTDIAGIVDEVYYDGGEFVREGSVIAKLSVSDYQSQLNILKAKLDEQVAKVEHLKAMPTPEQIAVAEEKLELAYINARFSEEECERQRPLHKSGGISESQMAQIEIQCATDRQKVLMAEAELSELAAGASHEQIAAAELSLLPIEAEIKMLENKIERSQLKMPFDGRIATLSLKERTGQFLTQGSPFALVQDDRNFKAVLKVPESELSYVKVGSKVKVKTSAYPDKNFKATVRVIEPDVEEQNGERMIRMIISFDSNEDKLKSGLSGYAKVDGGTFMVWEVLANYMVKFVTVDLWAWI